MYSFGGYENQSPYLFVPTVQRRNCLPGVAAHLLLAEGFSGGVVPVGGSSPNPSAWTVNAGILTQGQYVPMTRYVLSYDAGLAWTDYRVEADLWSDGWYHCRSSLRLYFRYSDVDNNYFLHLFSPGEIEIAKRQGGAETLIAAVTVGQPTVYAPARYSVEVVGSLITVFRDGAQILQHTDSTYTSGTIGVESVHIPGYFDNVVVTGL